MPDFNKVILMGRLTFDPELKSLSSGACVSELRMAVNNKWKDKNGDVREDVTYVDVTVWDATAKNCCQYLRKGSAVHVEGKLKLETWSDKQTGENRSKMKVTAERVQFIDKKPGADSGTSNNSEQQYSSAARSEPARQQSYTGAGNRPPAKPAPSFSHPLPSETDEDDIPF